MGSLVAKVLFKNSKENLTNVPKTFWENKVRDIQGYEVNMESLKGKKAFLIVNVASACGLASSNYR